MITKLSLIYFMKKPGRLRYFNSWITQQKGKSGMRKLVDCVESTSFKATHAFNAFFFINFSDFFFLPDNG